MVEAAGVEPAAPFIISVTYKPLTQLPQFLYSSSVSAMTMKAKCGKCKYEMNIMSKAVLPVSARLKSYSWLASRMPVRV